MPKEVFKNILKEYLWIIVATLIIAGLTAVVFVPKIKDYRKTIQDLKKQDQEIALLAAKLNELNALSKEELQKNYSLTLKAIPENKDFFSIINNLKNIFQQENVALVDFSINVGEISTASAATVKGNSNEENSVRVSLSFSGLMENAQKAIGRLENSLPLVSIDSFRLKAETATMSADLVNYQGDLVIKGIFSLLPKQLGAVGKELPKVTGNQKKLLEKIAAFEFKAAESVTEGEIVVGKENPFPVY